jgi:hypothetical protein
MISTVTTSTVSTVTTAALAGSVALIGIWVLFVLLLQKEVTTVTTDHRFKKLRQALNIGILPLLIAFILIVIAKVSEYIH